MRQTNSNGPPKRSTFHHGHYEKKIKKNPDGGRRLILYIMGALLIPAFMLTGFHIDKVNNDDGTTITQATTTTMNTAKVTHDDSGGLLGINVTIKPTTATNSLDETAFIMRNLWHSNATAFFFGKQLTEPTSQTGAVNDRKTLALHVLMRAARSSPTWSRPLVT